MNIPDQLVPVPEVVDGDTVGLGDEQVHVTESEFAPPEPVKVKVSFWHGARMEMDTEFC